MQTFMDICSYSLLITSCFNQINVSNFWCLLWLSRSISNNPRTLRCLSVIIISIKSIFLFKPRQRFQQAIFIVIYLKNLMVHYYHSSFFSKICCSFFTEFLVIFTHLPFGLVVLVFILVVVKHLFGGVSVRGKSRGNPQENALINVSLYYLVEYFVFFLTYHNLSFFRFGSLPYYRAI